MMNNRSLALVFGYIPQIDRLNPFAKKLHLNKRFAFALDTYSPQEEGVFFDVDLFLSLLQSVLASVSHDRVEFIGDFNGQKMIVGYEQLFNYYQNSRQENREPFYEMRVFKNDSIVLFGVTLFYTMVGGPDPYHDTYLTSFYCNDYDQSKVKQQLVNVCEQNDVSIRALLMAKDVPQISWWTRIKDFFLKM
ncbi:hypothetical protein K1X76_09470 [bacterium]|nr:hypothetical protein [bacterium]